METNESNAAAGLIGAVDAVLRDALDSVEVHVCDEKDDAVRAKGLYGAMATLYAARKSHKPLAASSPVQAQADLHNAIMNLPCKRTMSHFVTVADAKLYKEGHRDARHAAAELVAAAEDALSVPVQAQLVARDEAWIAFGHIIKDAERLAASHAPHMVIRSALKGIFKSYATQPAVAPAAPSAPTEISEQLRQAHATESWDWDLLISAAKEIERYYNGMMAWKRTAEAKDAAALAARKPAAPDHPVIEMLLEVARRAHDAMDNSEERSGTDEDAVYIVQGEDFAMLDDAMNKLDALPDDQPGYVMGPAAKAAWALRLAAPSIPAQAGVPDTSVRDAALEEAAQACVTWGNEKVRKWQDDPEMSEDAKARAWDALQCASVIRALQGKPEAPKGGI